MSRAEKKKKKNNSKCQMELMCDIEGSIVVMRRQGVTTFTN